MWTDIVFGYVCPSLGCIMAAAMFAAPVGDLRQALLDGHLGSLNPLPWAVMTGNCLGWCAYGYYTNDPFILASNFPGLVLSLWLNMGAAKLQYFELRDEGKDSTEEQILASESLDDAAQQQIVLEGADSFLTAQKKEDYVLVPQEVIFLRIVIAWVLILIWVGWLQPGNEAANIGLIVNVNLIFFYGAPLQAMQTVIQDRASNSIHVPTMMMNWLCTSFWLLYGIAQLDPVIYAPNAIGLLLGITQGILCLMYPRKKVSSVDMQPLLLGEVEEEQVQAE